MEIEDMVYRISPVETLFFDLKKYGARIKMRAGRSGGMRAKKRRIAKPVRFTLSTVSSMAFVLGA